MYSHVRAINSSAPRPIFNYSSPTPPPTTHTASALHASLHIPSITYISHPLPHPTPPKHAEPLTSHHNSKPPIQPPTTNHPPTENNGKQTPNPIPIPLPSPPPPPPQLHHPPTPTHRPLRHESLRPPHANHAPVPRSPGAAAVAREARVSTRGAARRREH